MGRNASWGEVLGVRAYPGGLGSHQKVSGKGVSWQICTPERSRCCGGKSVPAESRPVRRSAVTQVRGDRAWARGALVRMEKVVRRMNLLGRGAGMSEAEGSTPPPTCYTTPSHQDGFGDPPTKMEQVWWRGEKWSFGGALGLVS